MSDNTTNSELRGNDDVDPGEPIAVLAGYEQGASGGFLTRIRRRIQRRTTASQLALFWWEVPSLVLVEFLRIVMELSGNPDAQKGRKT